VIVYGDVSGYDNHATDADIVKFRHHGNNFAVYIRDNSVSTCTSKIDNESCPKPMTTYGGREYCNCGGDKEFALKILNQIRGTSGISRCTVLRDHNWAAAWYGIHPCDKFTGGDPLKFKCKTHNGYQTRTYKTFCF